MAKRGEGWRLAGVCVLGAVTLEVILIISAGLSASFTVRQIPAHVAAIAVGAVGGWIFELFRQLHEATRGSIVGLTQLSSSVETLTQRIRYQDKAIGMLTSCPRHNAVLTQLLKASMSDHLRHIPFVGVGDYLAFLSSAVEHSNGYQGIQRQPLRWYRESNAEYYLTDLRERRMKFKTRLIVVDDDDVPAMQEDLVDQATLDYYWSATGEVDTYWTSASEFRTAFPGFHVPDDFALYDRELMIAYDEARQILTFDVLSSDSEQARIFAINEQLVAAHSGRIRNVGRRVQHGSLEMSQN